MSLKSKGINAERDLIHKFWAANGWAAIRVAGSGSMKYPSADIVATNRDKILAIECKVSKNLQKYISKEDIEQIKKFAYLFNAKPIIAIKFKGQDWFFINAFLLKEKKSSFLIDLKSVEIHGENFESIIN